MTMFRYVPALLLLLLLSPAPGRADAGPFARRQAGPCPGGRCSAPRELAQPVRVSAPAPAPAPAGSEPYAAVNSVRARHGLAPLAFDPELAAWAAGNSAAQASRGRCGHFVSGPGCWQCAAPPTADPVGMWYADGAHRAILLNPALTRCGIAESGGYWTLDAR